MVGIPEDRFSRDMAHEKLPRNFKMVCIVCLLSYLCSMWIIPFELFVLSTESVLCSKGKQNIDQAYCRQQCLPC